MTAPVGPPFQIGDIVRHAGAFLRSTGWYTSVPINGEVTALEPLGAEGAGQQLLTVAWSDGTTGKIVAGNVEFCPRGRALTLSRRAAGGARCPT